MQYPKMQLNSPKYRQLTKPKGMKYNSFQDLPATHAGAQSRTNIQTEISCMKLLLDPSKSF